MLLGLLGVKLMRVFHIFYLAISIITSGLLLYAFSNADLIRNVHNYQFFYLVITMAYLNILPKSIFGISLLVALLVKFFRQNRSHLIFLSGSALLCFGMLLSIGYGILFGRNEIRVEKVDLYFEDIPKQLNNLKIVQLSDIHLGSFNSDKELLQNTVQIIRNINPDLLLFTGDMVNNFSSEINGYESCLRQLPAKLWKFAIQGNHDYGDYSNWPISISKLQN